MERRKLISYFLLMVSFVMLTAAVFPHHHHWTRICLSEDVDQLETIHSDCLEHSEAGESCNHHTTSNPCEQDCVTKFSFSTATPTKAVVHVPTFSLFTWTYAPLDEPMVAGRELQQQAPSHFYYFEHLHSVILYSTGGFRAPPCA